MSQKLISETEMVEQNEWSGNIELRRMSLISEPMETKEVYIGEEITLDELVKAIQNYLKFKHAKRGRKPKYYPDRLPSEWELNYDLKTGRISKSTYHRYKKLISGESQS